MTFARTYTAGAGLIAALCLPLLAAPSFAGIVTTPLPPGTYHLFSVPGVINGSGLGTYFLCTSTSTDPQSVTVEVFKGDGTASGSGTLVLGGEKSVMFGTQAAAGLTLDNVLGSGGVSAGAARILSTVKNKLLCGAFVSDAINSPPVFSASLNVVKKLKQKASN